MSAAPPPATSSVRWPLVGVFGLVSVVTMPLTAIWFLQLGFLTLMGTAVWAAVTRSPERTFHALRTGGSAGAGLLAGPLVYLTLAVLT